MLSAQESRGTAAITAIATAAVPPGTIGGTVSRRDNGKPVRYAQVFLEGTRVGALTNSLGRFRFVAPAEGRFTIVSQLIGYGEERREIQVASDSGLVVHIDLTERVTPLCGLYVCAREYCGSVRVIVRDALTGRAPDGPLVLRAQQDTTIHWDFADPRRNQPHVWMSTAHGPGSYDIEVAAPGYATWRRSDVVVPHDPCGLHLSEILQAWLLPLRETNRSENGDSRGDGTR